MIVYYDRWIASDFGIKPHAYKHDGSFNNIVYSTSLLIAMDRYSRGRKNRSEIDKFTKLYRTHLVHTNTVDGLYRPKNSHDNIMAKIAGLTIVNPNGLHQMNTKIATDGKHPRDIILFNYLLDGGWLWTALMPLAILDMVRAIYSVKIRPKWWDKENFWFRVKVVLGIYKPKSEYPIVGGVEKVYKTSNGDQWLRILQNDGQILNLLRLYALREDKKFKWLLPIFKKLYIKKLGAGFQSILMANYYEEYDHPVRYAFRVLEEYNMTVLD